jgi:hypothetical protein
MTVKDLIEVLQQSPNLNVPAVVRVARYDEEEEEMRLTRVEIADVRFDGGSVVIEAE